MMSKVLGAAAVVVLLGASAYAAFFVAPNELTMGIVQRIFYLHAPCGMTALAAFIVCFVGNLGFLFKREAKWDWLGVLHRGTAYRPDLGEAGVGRILGVGRAPDFHAGALAALSFVFDFADDGRGP